MPPPDAAVDAAQSFPEPPATIHMRRRTMADAADSRFSGKTATAVKLITYLGLPTALIVVGMVAIFSVYRDIAKPYFLKEIEAKDALTQHAIKADTSMQIRDQELRIQTQTMQSIAEGQATTNKHLESIANGQQRMWQVMENRRPAKSDEQGRADTPQPGPPGTEAKQ